MRAENMPLLLPRDPASRPPSSHSPAAHLALSPATPISPHARSLPPSRPGTSYAATTPTNDAIEAVIQLAMASSGAPAHTPPRDTRTQLFVGNLPYRVRWQDLKDLFRRAGTVLRADVALGPDNRSRGYGTVLLASAADAGRAVDLFNGYCWQTRTLEVRLDRLEEASALSSAGGTMAGASTAGGATPVSRAGVGSTTPFASAASAFPGASTSFAGPVFANMPSPLDGGFPGTGAGAASPFAHSVEEEESRPGTTGGAGRSLFVGNLPFHIQWQDLKDLFRQAGTILRADVALGTDGRSRGFGTVSYANESDAERAVRMFNGYEYNGRALKVHYDKFSTTVPGPAELQPHTHLQPQPPVPWNDLPIPQRVQPADDNARYRNMGWHVGTQGEATAGGGNTQAELFKESVMAAFGVLARDAHTRALLQHGYGAPQMNSRSQAPTHIPMPYRSSYGFVPSTEPSSPYDLYIAGLERERAGWPLEGNTNNGESSHMPHAETNLTTGVTKEMLSDSDETNYPPRHSPQPPVGPPQLSKSQPNRQCHSSSSTLAHAHAHSGSGPGRLQHPGQIAIPPPPPANAFPLPAPHTMSPPYPAYTHHPMSPMHPAAMMAMNGMTPHGLPPITPSMPSFTFHPQGPAVPVPASPHPAFDPRGPLHGHIMSPYTPFSPGVTMSPGAFWGRPGSGAGNPYINPAVGAPVHPFYMQQRREGEEPQGYFPPVPPQEPQGYFPPVAGGSGSGNGGTNMTINMSTRPSGLAHEIDVEEREVSIDACTAEERGKQRAASPTSEGTTTATGTSPQESSSRGTSWDTDEDSPQVDGVTKELGTLVVDVDVDGTEGPLGASSAVSPVPASAQPYGKVHRADSDPVRTLAKTEAERRSAEE